MPFYVSLFTLIGAILCKLIYIIYLQLNYSFLGLPGRKNNLPALDETGAILCMSCADKVLRINHSEIYCCLTLKPKPAKENNLIVTILIIIIYVEWHQLIYVEWHQLQRSE